MKSKRIIYYTDPIHDDFAANQIKTKKVGEDFPFANINKLWNLFAFSLLHCGDSDCMDDQQSLSWPEV